MSRFFAVLVTVIVVLGLSTYVHGQAAGEADALFKAKCAMCHGQDATGKTPMGAKLNIPDLRATEVQKLSAAELTQVIAKGKNKMPAYEGKLTGDQIAQIATYIRQLKK